jgi:hypothetical protein
LAAKLHLMAAFRALAARIPVPTPPAEMLRNMNSRERSILSGAFNSLERLRIPLEGAHIIDL